VCCSFLLFLTECSLYSLLFFFLNSVSSSVFSFFLLLFFRAAVFTIAIFVALPYRAKWPRDEGWNAASQNEDGPADAVSLRHLKRKKKLLLFFHTWFEVPSISNLIITVM
jgi:drug/metabolite transporter (DMT)-like permease